MDQCTTCLAGSATWDHLASFHGKEAKTLWLSKHTGTACPWCYALITTRAALANHVGSHKREYCEAVLASHAAGASDSGSSSVTRKRPRAVDAAAPPPPPPSSDSTRDEESVDDGEAGEQEGDVSASGVEDGEASSVGDAADDGSSEDALAAAAATAAANAPVGEGAVDANFDADVARASVAGAQARLEALAASNVSAYLLMELVLSRRMSQELLTELLRLLHDPRFQPRELPACAATLARLVDRAIELHATSQASRTAETTRVTPPHRHRAQQR